MSIQYNRKYLHSKRIYLLCRMSRQLYSRNGRRAVRHGQTRSIRNAVYSSDANVRFSYLVFYYRYYEKNFPGLNMKITEIKSQQSFCNEIYAYHE